MERKESAWEPKGSQPSVKKECLEGQRKRQLTTEVGLSARCGNGMCSVVSPLANLANIRDRNSDGRLKTNKATNVLCSFKTHLEKGDNKNQRRNWVKGAPLVQKRSCFCTGG